jgi:hypothetical protein
VQLVQLEQQAQLLDRQELMVELVHEVYKVKLDLLVQQELQDHQDLLVHKEY